MSGVPMASQRRSLGVLAACADCVRTPPAPAATVLAYTPGDRTSPAPQAMSAFVVGKVASPCLYFQPKTTS